MSAKSEFISWQKLREICFERDNYTCVWCGEFDGVILHLDHLYPLSKGGTNDLENLVTSCERCNLGKHARIIQDAWIPIATCYGCGHRAHPRGTATMWWEGPIWTCEPCTERLQTAQDNEFAMYAEDGPYADLELEQYAWDIVEFEQHQDILAAKYSFIHKVSA
jgi:hypothetical protein